MSNLSCPECLGTGYIKNKIKFCENNKEKVSSHSCYKCENRKMEILGKFCLCNKCHGDGYIMTFKKTN